MNQQEIYRWIVFGLLITHFLISSTMWIINDTGKSVETVKKQTTIQALCNRVKNNSKLYFLSVVLIGISILFISLVIFEKPLNEGYGQNQKENPQAKQTTGKKILQGVKEWGTGVGYAFAGRNPVPV